jgi:5'-3' exonuclease
MARYALSDTANTFFRARHVASRGMDEWAKLGMALHLTLASTNMVVRNHKIDHVVFMLEGKSWRKSIYPQYKAHRAVANQAMTEAEQEENRLFWETYENLTTFLREKTNCSVLRHPEAEADDLIARFIALHPNDEIFIVSTDGDYAQLISPRVKQYNGVTNELITLEGYFKDNGKQVLNKDKTPKLLERDPEYGLFFKIVRGDSGDNVFSAYPGVREKGTKNSVGIKEAYEDRTAQGYKWNTFMLSRWVDHDGIEHRVKDKYELNKTLIDLNAQPQDIKDKVDATIRSDLKVNPIPQVGLHFLKFCGTYELQKISDQAQAYSQWLNAPYQGELHVKDTA